MLKWLMAVTSKIGARGQITLPKEVRQRFELEPGQNVAFVIKNDELTLVPLSKTLFDLEGVLEPSHLSEEALHDEVVTAQAKRVAKGG